MVWVKIRPPDMGDWMIPYDPIAHPKNQILSQPGTRSHQIHRCSLNCSDDWGVSMGAYLCQAVARRAQISAPVALPGSKDIKGMFFLVNADFWLWTPLFCWLNMAEWRFFFVKSLLWSEKPSLIPNWWRNLRSLWVESGFSWIFCRGNPNFSF